MKSIEELLEIIKGVDMDLWDNVEQEAYDEILSRFAEKDKRIAELEKLPQIKYIYGLITKIAELEKQIESLKCCGNCKEFHHCQFLLSDADVIVRPSANFDCDKWEGYIPLSGCKTGIGKYINHKPVPTITEHKRTEEV